MEWILLSFLSLDKPVGEERQVICWPCAPPAPWHSRAPPPLMLLSEVTVIPLPISLLECASSVRWGRSLIKSQHSGIGY